jgi:hypothetical protein
VFSCGRKKLRGVEVENCFFYARSRGYWVVSEQNGDHSLILTYYFLFWASIRKMGFHLAGRLYVARK